MEEFIVKGRIYEYDDGSNRFSYDGHGHYLIYEDKAKIECWKTTRLTDFYEITLSQPFLVFSEDISNLAKVTIETKGVFSSTAKMFFTFKHPIKFQYKRDMLPMLTDRFRLDDIDNVYNANLAAKFLESCILHPLIRDDVKDTLRKIILAECRSHTQVDLQDFARKHAERINVVLAEENSPSTDDHARTQCLMSMINALIVADELKGVLDGQKLLYIDRDFVIKEKKVTTINLDFNLLIKQLGDQGIRVSTIQCPGCKAPCKLPTSGSFFTCDTCGAVISATDIFDMFN